MRGVGKTPIEEPQVPTYGEMQKILRSNGSVDGTKLANLFNNGAECLIMNSDGRNYKTDIFMQDGGTKSFTRKLERPKPSWLELLFRFFHR